MNTRGPDHHYGQILARQIEQTNAQRTIVEAAEWGAIVMHIRLFSTPLACVGLRYAVPVLVPSRQTFLKVGFPFPRQRQLFHIADVVGIHFVIIIIDTNTSGNYERMARGEHSVQNIPMNDFAGLL